MKTQGKCLICGETKLDTGKPRLRAWFVRHIRLQHTNVVFAEDVLKFDQNYWKQETREEANESHP